MINMAYSVFFKFSRLIAHTVLCHQIQFKKSTLEIFKWHESWFEIARNEENKKKGIRCECDYK